MNILITGASGYLGSRLAEHLQKKHNVRGLVRNSYVSSLDNCDIWRGDVTEPIFLFDKLDNNICEDIDVVIHCAAINEKVAEDNPAQAFVVNCTGTYNMLKCAKEYGVKKFIYLSTFHVYGLNEGTINENTPLNPKSVHGKTHLIGENYCRLFDDENFKTIILRFANGIGKPVHYDVKRWDVVVNECCHSAILKNEINMKSDGRVLRDFVAISDLCQAIDIMIKKNNLGDGIFNVGSGKSTTVKQVVDMIVEECDYIYGKKVKLTCPRSQRKIIPMRYDVSKLKKLGYKSKTNVRNEIIETLQLCSDYINCEYNRV